MSQTSTDVGCSDVSEDVRFTPPLDVMAKGWSPHQNAHPPTVDDVVDVVRPCYDVALGCLICLSDGDVWLCRLDVDIRCLDCVHVADVYCGTDGSEELIYDEAEVNNDVCVTDGDVELGCLDVLVGCLGYIHVADVACITHGVVAL